MNETVYRFKDWGQIYENFRSREVATISYFCQPNKLTGECLGHMLQQPDGLELYGTLGFLKMLASTAEKKHRGALVRNGTPMDAARMSALLRIPTDKIQRALDFFSAPPMDWLVKEAWITDAVSTKHRPTTDAVSTKHRPPIENFTGLRTDIGLTDSGKRERRKGFASPEESRRAQTTQFASASARKRELEAVPEDERTEEQEDELKKTAALLRRIQKKQRAGDFTPVVEDES